MEKKKFIITIDTEGDNLWSWRPGNKITTENSLYLSRFQETAERYGFKPVWLTNYEMIMDDRYVDFISDVLSRGTGEIGMHLHAWNSPPLYDLPIENVGQPYLIEYPTEIMEAKIKELTNLILDRTGYKPISHRAGRWATNDEYFKLLQKHGYVVDCSVTPYKDWSVYPGQTYGSAGTNYCSFSSDPGKINETDIYEVPVSIVYSHKVFSYGIKSKIKDVFCGRDLWLRPRGNNVDSMKYVLQRNALMDKDYIMFMLHSSEMMPGGSQTFPDKESIEKLYKDVNIVFQLASEMYEGSTLAEYGELLKAKLG